MLDGKIDSYNTIDYSNKDNMLIKESNSPGAYSRAYDRSALKKNAEFMMTPNINKTPMKMMTRDPTPQDQYLGPVYDKNQRASAPQYELPQQPDPEFLGNDAGQVVHPPIDSPA